MHTTSQVKAAPAAQPSIAKPAAQPLMSPTVDAVEAPSLTEQMERARLGHSFGAISIFPPNPPIQPKRMVESVQRLSAFSLPGQSRANPVPVIPAGWAVLPRVQAKLTVGEPNDSYEQEADRVADQVMWMAEPRVQAKCACGGEAGAEGECAACKAQRLAIQRQAQAEPAQREEVVQAQSDSAPSEAAPDLEQRLNGSRGSGHALPADTRSSMESAFGADFGGVRVHTGSEAVQMNKELSAQAFTHGSDIYFNAGKYEPGSQEGKGLLAHELTHVVQQSIGASTSTSPKLSSLSAVSPARIQALPLVTNVVTSAAELGVGGNDSTATATVAGRGTRLTWTINPGGAAPAGVTVIGSGRSVRIRSTQPGGGAVIGGTPIIVRAQVTGTVGDFFDAPPVALVQVMSATYAANPALVAVPSLIPGAPPANSAEPNRDGINGNTAVVNAVTAPAGRPIRVAFRRSLGATVAGTTITSGNRTGNIELRITDTATQARLNEAIPSAVNPPVPMATMVVNSVPTRANALATIGPLGPYGVQNQFGWAASDASGAGGRIIGELMSLQENTLGIQLAGPNGWNGGLGFNPVAPLMALSVPANNWFDQVTAGAGALTPAGVLAIDINRFTGPGVPHLPRRLTTGQAFVYFSWAGGGATFSRVFDRGFQRRTFVGAGANGFTTEHIFPGAIAPVRREPYIGPPLIVLSNIVARPTAAGATGLAADGTATANLAVTSNVAGRTVNWSVLAGDIAITGGNPAALPATATLRAGVRTGNFRLRAADSIFGNRRVDGGVRVVPVRLRNMRAAAATVPTGTLTTTVNLNAEPGGRTVNWTVDAAAAVAGVTVTPPATGPGVPAMTVTITRPVGFVGNVAVTATDSVLAARTERVRIRFL